MCTKMNDLIKASINLLSFIRAIQWTVDDNLIIYRIVVHKILVSWINVIFKKICILTVKFLTNMLLKNISHLFMQELSHGHGSYICFRTTKNVFVLNKIMSYYVLMLGYCKKIRIITVFIVIRLLRA